MGGGQTTEGGERQRQRRRLRRFVTEAMGEGDASVLDEIWGELAVGRKWGDDFETMAAFREWIEGFSERYEEFTVELEAVMVNGRYGAARCRVRGVTATELYGVVPAGQQFDVPASIQVRFDEAGRLTSVRTDFDFLEFLPASSRYARTSFVETVEDGVIVVADGVVTDVNETALSAFGVDGDRASLVGEPVGRLLPDGATAPACGETTEIEGAGRRVYEVTASPLENNWNDEVGRVLVCRDVTHRRRRVQQLQVLSRVLRHNIRNDLNVVVGRIESAAAATDEQVLDEELAAAREQALELLETAETARDVQRVLGQTQRRRRDLVTAVESAADRVETAWPAASVETTLPDRLAVEATDPLADAVFELIENAWEHGGSHPRVRLSRNGDTAVLEIRDDGPGFPERELVVVEEGEETQLKHGSGLGLWFSRWVVTASGGELTVDRDGGETVVTVRLPVADA